MANKLLSALALGVFIVPLQNAAAAEAGVARFKEVKCGSDALLRLSAPAAAQGSLLLAELRGPKTLNPPKGKWNGKEILFWSAKPAGKTNSSRYRALLGVDLDQSTGKSSFELNAQNPAGENVTCAVTVLVTQGHFAVEKLQLPQQYVEPNPEQLKRAQEEQKRMREIFSTITPERLWQGGFRIPLNGVTSGRNFGKRRVLNGEPGSPHSGLDLPAATGTPVYAAQRGRVVLAEELYFPGNTVILDHGLGVYTLYGHLSEISVKVGDEVEVGALLGKAGATGRVTGPHLHWGLTVNRARVDPMQIVKMLPNG